MKKHIMTLLLVCGVLFSAQAQFKWGAKVGIGTSNLRPENNDEPGSFKFSITDTKFGYYVGAFASLKAGPILFQPEVLFNSNRVNYKFVNLKGANTDTLFSEKYNRVDVPLLLGFKLGPIRAKVGPVAHINVNSSSELANVQSISTKWNTAQWGYQAGIGLNFSSRVHVDIRYEGNLDKWGQHIAIGGKEYAFAQKPERWLVNLGYAF